MGFSLLAGWYAILRFHNSERIRGSCKLRKHNIPTQQQNNRQLDGAEPVPDRVTGIRSLFGISFSYVQPCAANLRSKLTIPYSMVRGGSMSVLCGDVLGFRSWEYLGWLSRFSNEILARLLGRGSERKVRNCLPSYQTHTCWASTRLACIAITAGCYYPDTSNASWTPRGSAYWHPRSYDSISISPGPEFQWPRGTGRSKDQDSCYRLPDLHPPVSRWSFRNPPQ